MELSVFKLQVRGAGSSRGEETGENPRHHPQLVGIESKHWFHWDPAMALPCTTAPSAGMGACRINRAWVCFHRWGSLHLALRAVKAKGII